MLEITHRVRAGDEALVRGDPYCPSSIVAPDAMAGPVVAVGKNWINPLASGLPSNVTVPEIGWPRGHHPSRTPRGRPGLRSRK